MSLFAELKRRNVVRTGIAYVLIAWVVLQIIDFMLELTDAPSWVLQVFFITALVGLPVVLLLSWVYEMTPEGIKREKDITPDESITPETGRKLDRLIITALALVVVVLLAGHFVRDDAATLEAPAVIATELAEGTPAPSDADVEAEPATPSQPSIAVLPFVNMSPDPDQEYFADGISEEILNVLARVNGLKVAGRTSSFAFKGQNQDLREIGQALGVETILEGSVRSQGDRVRITAQLIQAEDGFHLWSETFDREMNDIFAIQDEIANAILQQARIQLLDEQQIEVRRTDPIAFQNYVAAKQRIHERTQGGLRVAVNLLKDAVDLDPTFAGAWAQLGIATMLLSDGFGSYGDIPEAEAQAMGRQYLERALAIEPELAEGHAGMGLYWQNQPPFTSANRQTAIEHLERSLAINPSDINAAHWLQRANQFEGNHGKSLEILEQLVERDPLYWPAVSNLVAHYVKQQRLERARELNDRTMRYRPELPFRQSAMILRAEGRHAEASRLASEVWRERSDPLTFNQYAFSHYGLLDFATPVDDPKAPDTNARVIGLLYLQRFEEAMQLASRILQENGNPGSVIMTLTVTGRHDQLVAFFRERWTSPTAYYEQQGGGGGWGYDEMLDLALAFRESGEAEWYREAMSLVRQAHDKSISVGFDTIDLNMIEAGYWAMMDEPNRAMDQIDRALAKGMARGPRLAYLLPQLRSLEGVPRYEQQQQRAMANVNEQRQLAGLPPFDEASL